MKSVCAKHEVAYEGECPWCEPVAAPELDGPYDIPIVIHERTAPAMHWTSASMAAPWAQQLHAHQLANAQGTWRSGPPAAGVDIERAMVDAANKIAAHGKPVCSDCADGTRKWCICPPRPGAAQDEAMREPAFLRLLPPKAP